MSTEHDAFLERMDRDRPRPYGEILVERSDDVVEPLGDTLADMVIAVRNQCRRERPVLPAQRGREMA
jgi:hypothetical protein